MQTNASPSNTSASQPTQKRSALACLPCRIAKNKCDGVPPPLIAELSSHLETKIPTGDDVQLRSDQACTRCNKLKLECLWQPSHRTGRPRKRARVQEVPADLQSQRVDMSSYTNAFDGGTATLRDSLRQGNSQGWEQVQSGGQAEGQRQGQAREEGREQAQGQDQGQVQADESFSFGSFQLSEAQLMALLNSSPFDSSRAAIDPEQQDFSQRDLNLQDLEQVDLNQEDLYLEDLDQQDLDLQDFNQQVSQFQSMFHLTQSQSQQPPSFTAAVDSSDQARTQPNQFITSLDQIVPPHCSYLRPENLPTPSAQSASQASPLSSSSFLDASTDESSTNPTSRTRSHLSALRARLNAAPRSPSSPSTPHTVELSSIADVEEFKDKLLCYINRASDPSKDDRIDAAVLEKGVELYFSGFAKTAPLLGDLADFEAVLGMLPTLPLQNTARRLLLRVIAALGYLVSLSAEMVTASDKKLLLQRLRSEARALLNAAVDRIRYLSIRLDDAEALATLQVALLLAYDSYAQDWLPDAESLMRTAVDLALRMRLHQIDSPALPKLQLTEEHSESLRRTWWELYLTDWLFTGTTSGRIARCVDTTALEVAVHTPMDPGFARLGRSGTNGMQSGALKTEPMASSNTNEILDRQTLSQAYDIRIRTSLINECVKPPENPDEPDLDRIRAIDTILSNMMIVAQRHFVDASTNRSSSGADGSATGDGELERMRWANETRVELLFTSLAMLYSSRIHLHRLAWFQDLTMDFTTCSFNKPSGSSKHPRVDSPVPPRSTAADASRRQAMLSTSVTRIVSSADAIMRLIRLDLRMSSPSPWATADFSSGTADAQANATRGLPVHSPFIGCCNLVAAFGYVVAVAASGPEATNLPTYGDEVRLYDEEHSFSSESSDELDSYSFATPSFQHESSDMDPSIVASRTASTAVSTKKQDAMVWKIRAAISNIGFAESTLAQYANIWPICSVYQQEVALCRNAIDSTGPTGLQ
ncbi:hypothetical protein NDA16_003424 [Ustilago loliicola]|nr:hypothetical protein NDA16_003424 [Ustilago loliicola]